MNTPASQPLTTTPSDIEDQIRNTIYNIEDPDQALAAIHQAHMVLLELTAEYQTPTGPSLFGARAGEAA